MYDIVIPFLYLKESFLRGYRYAKIRCDPLKCKCYFIQVVNSYNAIRHQHGKKNTLFKIEPES